MYVINDYKNYHEDTRLDTNPSLTPSLTLALSTIDCSVVNYFTSTRCNIIKILNLEYIDSPCIHSLNSESVNSAPWK